MTHRSPQRAPWRRHTLVLALAAAWASQAQGFAIDTGSKDVSMRFDNTVRLNLGMRAQSPDQRILNNSTYDESDGKFGKGDLVTKRLDWFSEFDVDYQKTLGLRLSAAAWYDAAYDDTRVRATAPGFVSSYNNDQYNSTVKRYTAGPSGELLDAFVWANFRMADKPASLKIGRLSNYWGEAYFLGAHAISYSQSPVDGVKAVTSPGIEVKEVFLPLGQAYLKYQPTADLTLAAQYMLQWRHSRLPYGGTYFGPADPFFEGPDRLPVGGPASLARAKSIEPGRTGNWGLNARLNVESIESTLGFYYRRFNDYNPWFQPNFTGFLTIPGVGTVPTQYQLVYPKQVSLFGASFARAIGPVSVGAELSYRKDGALNAAGIDPITQEGPRGNTWHALVNGVYLFPKNPLFDTGSLVAELAYSRLGKVTSNEAYYRRAGSLACQVTPGGATGDKTDGCSTSDYVGMQMLFTPQYLQIQPSLDIELPMSLAYNLRGNAPSSGGGSEGEMSWSVGAKFIYRQKHELQLMYADTAARTKYDPTGRTVIGGRGSVGTTDRAWWALTFKTGF